MTALETYLNDLQAIHATRAGVAETSYYGALERLLNTLGQELRPMVRCVLTLKNVGAGLPDGGLFTAEQFERDALGAGQLPARGAVEAKGTGEAVDNIIKRQQVIGYVEGYGLVLVTNYWDFALVARGAGGTAQVLERYALAENEAAFWEGVQRGRALAAANVTRFMEFLQRVMKYNAPLGASKDVAWFLASYAREALTLVEGRDLQALQILREALEAGLGIRFEGSEGNHFFHSTLVQTLFYGIFSAWVLASRETDAPVAPFSWREAQWLIRVPVIGAIFEQIALPTRLGPLGLVPVLDRAAAVLNRVDRAAFFANFEESRAVTYFYEPFLKRFDPALRQQLGVWYTPPEIVQYMVERVDEVLREELGIAEGLADPEVLVLDPATGTGTYLAEVLKRIAGTLKARGEAATVAADLKEAATTRLFGFELLPAPFVVAHLQLGLLLQRYGAELEAGKERVGVFLTNALTGWEEQVQKALPLPELEQERDAAAAVKKQRKVLVVLGNPPYNGYAGVALGEERSLTEAYRTTRQVAPPEGQGLNELYVRFYRLAERQIVERRGQGIVCFISNNSWLAGKSHTGMRERYLDVFDEIWIDNLNGDKFETGKVTPWGESDPSVFSTELNREGIGVGTAIALFVRRSAHQGVEEIRYRDWWGKSKRADLLHSLYSSDRNPYQPLLPSLPLRLPFVPRHVDDASYHDWSLLPDLFPVSFSVIKTSRDEVVVEIDQAKLVERMRAYLDPALSHAEMARLAPRLMEPAAGFDPIATRDALLKKGFNPQTIFRYHYRPFDLRWLYWEGDTQLLARPVPDYVPHVLPGNPWLFTTGRTRKAQIGSPLVTFLLTDLNVLDSGARGIPLFLKAQATLLEPSLSPRPNLSARATAYLGEQQATPDDLFYHTLAVLHAPRYREENAGALRQDWPRVPLPRLRDALLASAKLGRDVAALLDPEVKVPGVTTDTLGPLLRSLAVLSSPTGEQLDPAKDLALTAGWGHAGRGGITMPGRGVATPRPYTTDEREALAFSLVGTPLDPTAYALTTLGDTTFDLALNERAYWRNVPANVWTYTLGGYPVLKKWLSYREAPLLARPLTLAEARYMSEMVRRIAFLLLLGPALNESYEARSYAVGGRR